MRLRVRHGILGETALTMDVVGRTTLGWDIMKQTANVLRLDSPFQVGPLRRQLVSDPIAIEGCPIRH